MVAPVIIAGLLGLGSSLIKGSAAKKAADTQAASGERALDFQKGIYKKTRRDFAPYRRAGRRGLDAYNFELGLGNKPKGYKGYQASESFNNMLTTGRDTIEAGASAGTGLFRGSTGTALEKFRMGLASNEVNTYLNRLGGLGQAGQAAAGMQANVGQNFAQMGTNTMTGIGNVQAAGQIGVGNAIAGGVNTGLGAYGFLRGLDNPDIFGSSGMPLFGND